MKRLALLCIAAVFSMGVFAQVAKYNPQVVVLFLGEKNPSFDESKYPDLKFYYTPEIQMKKSEKTKSQSNTTKAFSSVTGFGSQGMDETMEQFYGTPQQIIDLKFHSQMAYVFDKNGTFTAMGRNLVKSSQGLNDHNFIASKKSAMGKVEYITLRTLSKDYVKKGKTTKEGKKIKADQPSLTDYYGHKLPDFEVQCSKGEKKSFNEIVSSHPLTIVYTIQLDKDFDLTKGEESGAGKTGKQYAGDVLGSMAGQKKINALPMFEKQIFGK